MTETILIGVLQLVNRGTFTQTLLALLISILYLTVVLRLWPYRNHRNNNMAVVANLALVALFICCIAFRIQALMESPQLKDNDACLSQEQRNAGQVPSNILATLTFAAVVVIFVSSGLMYERCTRQTSPIMLVQPRSMCSR